MVSYIIEIPPATAFAPHQNGIDKKYYRCFDLHSVPMHDYEIRDLLRRAQTPLIVARLKFPDDSLSRVHWSGSENIEIKIEIENLSSEPALYSVFEVLLDNRLGIVSQA